MTVTASLRPALRTHIFVTAGATGTVAVALLIAVISQLAFPALAPHLTPGYAIYGLLVTAALFQVLSFLMVTVGWIWSRLHTWSLDAHGIACQRLGRRVVTLSWERIHFVSLLPLGAVHVFTTEGKKHVLGYVDKHSVKAAVPVEKIVSAQPTDGSAAAGDSEGREQ